MRSRCTLHRSKLEDFKAWCAQQGWKVTHPTAAYQVLRIDFGAKSPAIVYDRHEGDHLTVFDESLKLVKRYLKQREK